MKKNFISYLMIGSILLSLPSCKKKNSNDDDTGGGGSDSKIELAVSPWPCYGQNTRVSFASPNNGPATTPSEKWKVKLGSASLRSMVIGSDGVIYVNARRSLIAVNPSDGSVKWTYDAKMDLSEAALVDKNNIVYVTGIEYGIGLDTYGDVIAIKGDSGTLKWKYNSADSVNGGFRSSPNTGYEGYLYAAENDAKKLYALNAKGEKAWEFVATYPIIGMPVVGNDSIIYITLYNSADTKGSLVAINPGGTQKWKVDFTSGATPTPPVVGIPVGKNGYIYISYNGKMFCYKNTGVEDWSLSLQNGSVSTKISVSNAGALYFYCSSALVSMNDGSPVFEDPYVPKNATIGNDNYLYSSGYNSIVSHLYNAPSGTNNWSYSTGTYTCEEAATYPVLDNNGVIYVGTLQGYLIALK